MNNNHFYAVIMAGGGGTRLWPLSRQANPKQMVSFFGAETLFQMAVARLSGLFSYDNIYVVTVADQVSRLHQDSPEIPFENFIIEPQPRGTASVIGLGAIVLRKRDPQATMAVLTSDQYIKDDQIFYNLLNAAAEVAADDYLVTLGVTPSFPATGYGYIQHGDLIREYQGMPVYDVKRFKEKPDENQAQVFLEKGDHDWNSGMFVWRVDRILEEFENQMPALASGLERIARNWGTPEQEITLNNVWSTIKPETIDYGIMENAKLVAVIPATGLGWSDVGSWDSLFEVLPVDKDGNIATNDKTIAIDTTNSLVFSKDSNRLVATIGVDDLIIVDTGDALLVCHRNQTQKVRQLVSLLKQTHRKEYL
jgi:mannose-1-phosphate guanylyltransferase